MVKGRHFDEFVILLWVRWYLAFGAPQEVDAGGIGRSHDAFIPGRIVAARYPFDMDNVLDRDGHAPHRTIGSSAQLCRLTLEHGGIYIFESLQLRIFKRNKREHHLGDIANGAPATFDGGSPWRSGHRYRTFDLPHQSVSWLSHCLALDLA
jgi:hypothetical protein